MTKGRENRILQSSDRTFSPSDRANTGTSDQAFSLSDDNNVLNQEIYFVRDYLGNIKSIFDNNGEMLYYRLYDEFGGEFEGQSRSQDYTDQNDLTQPCFTPFGFTSREFDEIADLYFYRSRYYDPTLGRFTQRDKFNETGFITGNPAVIYNPLQLNDYTYVGNNPLIYTDPWGFCKDRGFWTKIWDGDYVGTQFGAESTLMNAINYEQADTIAGKIIWGTAGIFSSLWTPENWKGTVTTFISAQGLDIATKHVATSNYSGLIADSIRYLHNIRINYWGKEIVVSNLNKKIEQKVFRLNPFGDWTSSNKYGRRPHYHRRGNGKFKHHRPWERGW